MDFGRVGFILLHPVTFLITSTIVVIGGGNSLWKKYRDQLPNSPEKTIASTPVSINEPGPWALPGTTRLVTDQFAKLQTSILDPAAVQQIADAIEDVPAIESVESIAKSPSGIAVVAAWRQPVAVIPMEAGYFRLLDRHGMVLDRQVTSEAEAMQWLRIGVSMPGNQTLADWQIWQDSRVREAAAIAGEVGPDWRELGLAWVVTFRKPADVGPPVGTFELWTAKQAKVIWSDNGAVNDPKQVAQRLEAIRSWIIANGSLDILVDRKLILDVRSGAAKLISDQPNQQLSENGIDGIFRF